MIRTLIISFWLLAVHAVAFLAIFDTDLMYRVDRKLGTDLLNPPEITWFYEDMLGSQLQLDNSVEAGSVIFLGDSLTQALNVAAVAHPSINYGIGMDTSAGFLQRIPHYQSLSKASTIVIAVSINDLLRTSRSNADIVENYQQILGVLPKGVPVILQAIFPVDERLVKKRLNQRVQALNESIQQLATRHQHTFINLHKAFAGADGNLKSELHVGDGIHFSATGYRLWIDAIKTALSNTSTLPP